MATTGYDFKIGDNLLVKEVGGTSIYYTINAIDDILYRDSHASLASNATESFLTVTNLNPPIGQLIWIGAIELDGNVTLQIKHPAATNRWGTNLAPQGGYIVDHSSPITSGRAIDIWIEPQQQPATQLVNNTNVSITPILWWIGKRFSVTALTTPPSVYSIVKIGGISD